MIELELVSWINHLGQGTIIDKISGLVSWKPLLYLIVLLACIAILYFDRKNGKKVVIMIIVSLIIFLFFNAVLIKGVIGDNLWARERPYLAYPSEVTPIGDLSTDSSFPSDHVTGLVAFLVPIMWYCRKSRVWAVLAILIMCWSRLHNGMHYPTDVLAGVVLGGVYGWIGMRLTERFYRR